jgi:hypothetical protein
MVLMQPSASWAQYTTPNLMGPPEISLAGVFRYQRWGRTLPSEPRRHSLREPPFRVEAVSRNADEIGAGAEERATAGSVPRDPDHTHSSLVKAVSSTTATRPTWSLQRPALFIPDQR